MGKSRGTKDGKTCVYIVAYYKPKGNRIGEFQENVFLGNFNEKKCGILNNDTDDINVIGNTDTHNVSDSKEESNVSDLADEKHAKENNESSDASISRKHSPIDEHIIVFNKNKYGAIPDSIVEGYRRDIGVNYTHVCVNKRGFACKRSPSSFEENGLQAHNIFRNIHGVKKMRIDPILSKDAELYAKELARIGVVKHAHLKGIGENLAYRCSSDANYQLSAIEATKRWYGLILFLDI